MVSPDIRVFPPAQLTAAGAAVLAAAIEELVASRGWCRIALAGGSTPKPIYERMVGMSVPWTKVELFFGDERLVGPGDPASNYAMVKRSLIDHIDIPSRNVHRIRGELPADEAARAYAELLGNASLDIALLGMGDDGHTASLFPETADMDATDLVSVTHSPMPPYERVSLGLRTLNRAGTVYLLVAGAAKAVRLAEVRVQIASGAPVLPAARLQPETGRLIWLIDSDAAGADISATTKTMKNLR